MGKKSSSAVKSKVPATSGAAPGVAIDDIFASKAKKPSTLGTVNAVASSSKLPSAPTSEGDLSVSGSKAKKKQKKQGQEGPSAVTEEQPASLSKPPKRRVEEVLDPSAPAAPSSAVPLTTTATASQGTTQVKKKAKKGVSEDDEMFADSRGTGPRRKTEEGYLIYKEAELQINPEAGGTPLCPFDCDCLYCSTEVIVYIRRPLSEAEADIDRLLSCLDGMHL